MCLLLLPYFEKVNRIVVGQNLESITMILEQLLVYDKRHDLRHLVRIAESFLTFLDGNGAEMVAIVDDDKT